MNMKKFSIIFLLIILFSISLYLSLFAGYGDNGFNLLLKAFHPSEDADSLILHLLRYPRVIKAIIAGSCLAVAGLFMQAITKNPLAEPYLTGVSSGAGLGIILSILFLNSLNYPFYGFLGAIVSSILVISFAGFKKFSVTKLILIGLSLNIFAGSLISFLILINSEKAYSLMFILTGGFSNSDMVSNRFLVLIFFAVMLISLFFIPKLNYLRLDENIVISNNGTNKKLQVLIILLSAFLTSLSVFAAGILGFVGIVAPQISKMLVGQDYRYLFVTNILLGSIILLVADFMSRVVIYPMQIPLGIVVAFVGAPIFVFFLTKKGGIFND